MRLPTQAERLGLRAAMALPPRAQRVLAGRPVVLDGQTLAVDLQLMLRMQRLLGVKGAETLPPEEGRAALRDTTAHTAGQQPIGSVRSLRVAGLPARLYVPRGAPATGPLVVYFHGGGFFCGDLESHDGTCRFLAEGAGTRVLAVDYRLAPEHPFPAAHDDAESAYRWVVEHASDLGADPARIGVGGDSAGGNLSAHVAIVAAREGLPCAVQLLVYPATQSKRHTRSFELFGHGFYLTREFMALADRWFVRDTPPEEPRVSPMHAELPAGLAPALVYTAGFDPLRDEGEGYAERLREAGALRELKRYPDQIHGFFSVVGVGRTSVAANREIARQLRSALTSPLS